MKSETIDFWQRVLFGNLRAAGILTAGILFVCVVWRLPDLIWPLPDDCCFSSGPAADIFRFYAEIPNYLLWLLPIGYIGLIVVGYFEAKEYDRICSLADEFRLNREREKLEKQNALEAARLAEKDEMLLNAGVPLV